MGAKSQDKATKQNAKNSKAQNQTNLLLNVMSRGFEIDEATARKLGVPELAGKSSALLPYYLGNTESELGQGAAELARALQAAYATPEKVAEYQGIADSYASSQAGLDSLAKDVASGQITDQMLAEAEPVAQARLDMAETRKNAKLEQLRETISETDAVFAKKGYSGDAYGNRMMKFNARRNIASEAATELADARLQNAMQKAALQEQGRSLRLGNLDIADKSAAAAISRKQMGARGAADAALLAMAPLKPFTLGPGQFTPAQAAPLVSPNASPLQLAAQATGQAGNMALNYWLQSNLASKYANAAKPPPGVTG